MPMYLGPYSIRTAYLTTPVTALVVRSEFAVCLRGMSRDGFFFNSFISNQNYSDCIS
jgi:hypothetical protein